MNNTFDNQNNNENNENDNQNNENNDNNNENNQNNDNNDNNEKNNDNGNNGNNQNNDNNNDNNEKDNNDNDNNDNEKDNDNDNEKENENNKVNKNNKGNKKENKNKKEKEKIVNKSILFEDIREDLKEIILNWIALEEKINELNIEIKDLKDEKKQFENYIIDNMRNIKENIILTNRGNIIRNTRENKTSITSELIQATLSKILRDESKASLLTSEIESKRPLKQSITLKIKNNK